MKMINDQFIKKEFGEFEIIFKDRIFNIKNNVEKIENLINDKNGDISYMSDIMSEISSELSMFEVNVHEYMYFQEIINKITENNEDEPTSEDVGFCNGENNDDEREMSDTLMEIHYGNPPEPYKKWSEVPPEKHNLPFPGLYGCPKIIE